MEKRAPLSRTGRQILDAVRRQPGISRSALTAHTDVTQQSVHRLVETFVATGLLRLSEPVIHGRGKPSPGLELVGSALFSIGVSVNTDCVQLSLADLSCLEIANVPLTAEPGDRLATLRHLRLAIDRLLAEHRLSRDRLLGAGFAISGFRTGRNGVFVAPVPLSDWSNRELQAEIELALGLPVWLENNATSGAIGEAMVGAGLAHDTFAYLSFNYGFGGGIVSRGEAVAGGHGNAGEMSAMFLPSQMKHRPALGELMLRLRDQGVAVASIGELARDWDPTWPAVAEWVREVTPQLNLVIRALRAIIDPTAVVFGGEAPPELRQQLISACDTRVLDRYGSPIPSPVLLNSTMPNDPAAFGAALIPLKETVLL